MKWKEEIEQERAQGLSYRKIAAKLGINTATVQYTLSSKYRENDKKRSDIYRNVRLGRIEKPEIKAKKLFEPYIKVLRVKVYSFQKRIQDVEKFTYLDVINKFGLDTHCYITGKSIDLRNTNSYHFDHIVPIFLGGEDALDNLGICTPDVNQAKNKLSLEEFLEMCRAVVRNNPV